MPADHDPTPPRLDWGVGPSERHAATVAAWRPLFQRIAAEAAQHDVTRTLPHAAVAELRAAGFTRLRLPASHGGQGLRLAESIALLIELGEADPNLPNIFRSHAGFLEELLDAPDDAWRARWLDRLAGGDLVGSGFSEAGDAPVGSHSTRLVRSSPGQWRLNGEKFYTTGSLYADWVHLAAVDGDGQPIGALVPTRAPGVQILDDWDGFGQRLTASGTARFTDVRLDDSHIRPQAARFRHATAFFQLVHLAELAGIGRAATQDLARLVAARKRIYGNRGTAGRVSQDAQVLEVVGRVRSAAYAAGAVTLHAAAALERALDVPATDPAREPLQVQAELEVGQAVTVVTRLVLEATTELFDALGASAARQGLALDRHWRNARTISSHNPRIYHTRIVGDHAVTGSPPPARGGLQPTGLSAEVKANGAALSS